MKKIFLSLLISFFVFQLFSEPIAIKVIEKRGIVDIKKDNSWTVVSKGDIVAPGTEIFTGVNAQLTLEIGNGSYITLNQLSNAVLKETKEKNFDSTTEMFLINGYIVVYSKKIPKLKTKIIINFAQGNTVFQESGGEVYLRKEQGAIIKSFLGYIKINPKNKTFYSIGKNEICAITKDGMLIENDYFLRRVINSNPSTVTKNGQLEAYYNFLFQPYTSEIDSNDFKSNNQP
jgi:hypothetical protein